MDKIKSNEKKPLLKNHRNFSSEVTYYSDSAMSYKNQGKFNRYGSKYALDEEVEDDDDDDDDDSISEEVIDYGVIGKRKPIRINRSTKRTRARHLSKKLKKASTSVKKRVSAYCNFDQISIFRLVKWMERSESQPLPGSDGSMNGWQHTMYLGALHSVCFWGDREAGETSHKDEEVRFREKNVFVFPQGIIVFWGLTRTEEQAHLLAVEPFTKGTVKQVQVEDLDYLYGDVLQIANDSITLTSHNPCEKLAISFAMAQSCKLDVFEDRVGETITDTKHIPEMLATTGAINYSQKDISKLIGKLFIVRSDVNLNSEILDEPDFFWEYDEYEPLYAKTMQYLDVSNRVQILNSRLDILRELLEVLSQQLENQHATKLEWIIIWLIVAEVVVQVVWNILIKDILGFFPGSSSF